MTKGVIITAIIFQILTARRALAFKGSDLPTGVTNSDILTDAVEKVQTQSPLLFVRDDDTFASPAFSSEITPLEKTLKTSYSIPTRRATQRKRWGMDDDPAEYWFNNRVHSFGNTGVFGGLHAIVAPMATKIIDVMAYNGENARYAIARQLHELVDTPKARVLDMCCGVGMSTRALQEAFHDGEAVIGVDTSPAMISMAKKIAGNEESYEKVTRTVRDSFNRSFRPAMARAGMYMKDMVDRAQCVATRYVRGNAQRTVFPAQSFDLVTVMYAFHEAPRHGRYLMLREARRLLKDGGKLAIIDICPTYQPSKPMLAGEPYVLEYQQNIQEQIHKMAGFDSNVTFQPIVEEHVVMWILERKSNSS